jgi:DNA polymerase I-like protein with 3'-5' exonuclease and polymerase domains
LIKPAEGHGLAYIDYCNQELAIAAVLSNDQAMLDSYRSGDPYLDFARRAGAVPLGATKQSHGAVRDRFKTCALAVLYGAGAARIGYNLGLSEAHGHELLRAHKEQYRTYHRWVEQVLDRAQVTGRIRTVFGWTCHVGEGSNPRAIANFPMQANGAEMLRLACCFLTEAGIRVCAPVHDAVLITAPLDQLEDAVSHAQELMAEASATVLRGFELRTDVKLVKYPDRYIDERGAAMWKTVCEVLAEVEAGA